MRRSVHGTILAFLTLLFALRILGQLLVALFDVGWLPPMEQWFSGVIPYPLLLVIQLLMLVLMCKITKEVWLGVGFFAERRGHWSEFLKRFSMVYAGSMVLRYLLTMTLQPEMRWFGGVIPITFHFVLAAFIFTLGDYHSGTN
jgi:hypothetical protein